MVGFKGRDKCRLLYPKVIGIMMVQLSGFCFMQKNGNKELCRTVLY